jgi:hypothetical protein
MFSRAVSILIGSWLPLFALVLPLSPFHRVNALVAGTLATLLSFAALADKRASIATAVVGAWVALTPFIFASTLLEKVLTVSWGVVMFVHLIGPFSEAPRITVTRAPDEATPPFEAEPVHARAA